ncbi:uncharacterized protein LOC106641661 isoform X2 [Copidosoma floridanum]|uniref:uncharacterized protein LOC106641661 isoform X2 n=1 Tax=Copidosoma floridanum TaxID=29053 RepID=UPI000C6F6A06|nr:uncharacterized protein LOC106641661 isoform X2 [Copidosoma floridanum]
MYHNLYSYRPELNAGESRIPLPRTTARPSLLPKIRSLGAPPKIGSLGHRRSPSGYCSSGASFNKQQQFVVGSKTASTGYCGDVPAKQPKIDTQYRGRESTETKDKDDTFEADYSISTIWNSSADNKEKDQLMRLGENEKLGFLCSQEDLSGYDDAGIKKQESREDLSNASSEVGTNNNSSSNADYAIESPVATAPHYLMLTKQNSFEHDESLGILTPDQMTDFTVALGSSRTPSCENLSGHTSSGGKNSSVASAASRNLDIAACLPSIEALLPANDRSPSLEELPLDPRPVVIVVDEEAELHDRTLSSEKSIESPAHQANSAAELSPKKVAIDSTETSENTSEPTRCSVSSGHVLPTSFITSVTSITSLEAGYQGDGENSRPASRGAEPLSIAPAATLIVSAACRQDPMTDSDFFTESDADAHEEIVRGDRRAQVIDGTLFCAPNERRCPSFEPGEEMDSSGIYSDLDKRQDSAGVDAEGYGDGDHTTDTGDTGDTEISMKSQPSPGDKTPIPALIVNNALSPMSMLNDSVESAVSMAEVTVIKCQKNEQNSATKSKSNSICNKENSVPLKKYKMPKRNVISKIKTMIESNHNISKEETESESRRLQRQQRKTGRWDAVMNKIEASKQRSKPLKKDVKSRVLQNLGTSTSSTASTSSTRRATMGGDNYNNANIKDKRRIRGRLDTNSPNQETARSSVRSSASDLSSANSKEIPKRPPRKNFIDAHQPNNNQLNSSNANKSNISTGRKAPSIKSVQSNNVHAKQKNATTNKVADRNNRGAASPTSTTSIGSNHNNSHSKPDPAGPVINNHHHHQVRLNHNTNASSNHNHSNGTAGLLVASNAMETSPLPIPAETSPAPALKETRDQESQVDLFQRELEEACARQRVLETAWGKRADDTVQALAITVQYFTHRLESGANHRLKKDLEKMRTDWLTTKAELENLRLRYASVEDALAEEREEHYRALESLREELDNEQSERSSLEQSVLEERRRLQGLEQREREQRAALELELAQLRQMQQQQQQVPVVAPDQAALLAEVESLRTVLELRMQESAQLRSEVDLLRRDLDEKEVLRQRCEALEARCEDLKAQLESKESFERHALHENEVLMNSLHQLSKQHKRLSQRNEELTWRLRQKNEVVSVLTNQLTPQSQRLSKSLGPDHNDHCSTADFNCSQKSEMCSSTVRYLVEKGDSVSWTLDIAESMDTSSNESCAKSPSSATRRYRDSNGGLTPRQNSLRLSMPRRTAKSLATSTCRTRSNSVSTTTEVASATAASSTSQLSSSSVTTVRTVASNDETAWSPSYSSTPMQRRRNVPTAETAWSLSNTITETSSSSNSSSGNGGCNIGTGGCSSSNNGANATISTNSKTMTVELSTTDEEEEEEVGQRPQEAGGEAMISEETSTSSSSEDDESSVSSGDIP